MPLLALPYFAIDPILIEVGPFAIRWYALAYILGIFLGWWYAKRLVRDRSLWGPAGPPLTALDIDDFVVWAAVGIIVGGRLGYVLFYDLPLFLADPAEIIAVWHGGMSFHGGFLGTLIAMALFAWKRGVPVFSLLDVVAPSVTFGLFLGRLANFNNGELFGRVSDVPWAMVFCNDYIIAAQGECVAGNLPRHPSQLYEAALEGVALFVFLRLLTHRFHKLATPGFVAGGFLFGYGVARTFVEFFREPDIQVGYFAGWATMGMLLSVPMVIAGIALMLWSSRRTAPAAVGQT
ncbi:prolipoprotein diacylglyceryl transferase [soil metagenome]